MAQVGDLAEFELATYVRLRSLRQETSRARRVFRPLSLDTARWGHGKNQPTVRSPSPSTHSDQ